MASNQKSDIFVLAVYKQDVVSVRHSRLQQLQIFKARLRCIIIYHYFSHICYIQGLAVL